jgi:quinohemoprotein ethanol dehydrogenase
VRGYVSAYDATTGELIWRFYTVPGNPADGFENEAMEMAAETWTGEWWELGGGGTPWDAIVYDPELNLVYIGTGNGCAAVALPPKPGGRRQPVPGLHRRGRRRHRRVRLALPDCAGENWDYTATQPMILADLEIDGESARC